jgi:hypothetical protein
MTGISPIVAREMIQQRQAEVARGAERARQLRGVPQRHMKREARTVFVAAIVLVCGVAFLAITL